MGEKLIVGPINKGIQTNREPFVIDNDSFPVLMNAYQWRGRIKRRRGTALLGQLERYFDSTQAAYGSTSTITLSSGAGNLLTGFSLQTNGSIVPGSVTLTDTTSSDVYTDTAMDGTLSGTPSGSGTINYATGAITIVGGASDTVQAQFYYYPMLPVMGLEDLNLIATQFPGTIAFDTKYSYNILTTLPYTIYDVSFYKNPASSAYVGYTQKTNWTALKWNGQDYQQFWTVNYEGALWATNGINVPFSVTNIGMQYKAITTVDNITGGPPAVARLHIAAHGLVEGDFVFVNEVQTTTGINFQTGYVVSEDPQNAGYVDVEFPNATIASNGTGGIAQYLTSNADPTKDCIRYFDGPPVTSATPPVFQTGAGWVNFAPPLSQAPFSIGDEAELQWYLAGARIIVPFKDRLLFIGPVIQTSSSGSQVYLQDTVIFSQNGTPYYTCSFTGSVDSAATVFNPILTPPNQTATAPAYFEDQTGFGGFISAGFAQPILTAAPNEDVIILGFSNRQARLVYSGSDFNPFLFYVINSELGSGSTFSSVTLDRGVLTIGDHGIIQTQQIGAQRIDLEIPDNIFQFNLQNNGPQRITAQRDFINEWIYFTYLSNQVTCIYPNQTLQYNYRDDSWAIFNECYTTYGAFRRATGYTWATIGNVFPTWESWNEPWNAGSTTLLQTQVIGGNQQGFVLFRDEGTGEGNSVAIQDISGGMVTSPNHCLNVGDYIVINGCIGTVGPIVNGKIFSVQTITTTTFTLNPTPATGTYFGGGYIKRMYIPLIRTKQFPVAWGIGRKSRIGVQQYLLSTTAAGQIELQIYLSQNGATPYNFGPIVPSANSQNNSLIYSDVLYTCPESTNLGLTPANINLQMVTAEQQAQTWHRVNTSLLGDTIQLGFTMSDAQMRDPDFNNQFTEIELHGFILDVTPSMVLA